MRVSASAQFLSKASLLLVVVAGCGTPESPVATTQEPTERSVQVTDTIIPATKAPAFDSLQIGPRAFQGIAPGDSLARHASRLQPDVLVSGEGKLRIFRIQAANGQSVGYVVPDSRSQSLVGDVVITSPIVRTAAGIGVGDNFLAVEAAYPDIVVHGSEVESRTHAVSGNLSFRLAISKATYEVPRNTVPPTTKVLEVRLTKLMY